MCDDPEGVIRQLVAKLAAVPVREYQAEIAATLRATADYARHNECRLAVELLCDNLYEYDFPLTQTLLAEIERFVGWLGADCERFKPLHQLTA